MRILLLLLILPLSACLGEISEETSQNGIPMLEFKSSRFVETGRAVHISEAVERVQGVGSSRSSTATINISGIPVKVRRVRFDTYDFLLIEDETPGVFLLGKPNHSTNFKRGAGAVTGCAVKDVFRRVSGVTPTDKYLVQLNCSY